MSSIRYEDYSHVLLGATQEAKERFLYEAAAEIQAAAVQNSRVDTTQTRGAWDYNIEGNEAVIGNPLENAIWEEFGTGEYALQGNGRKGGWLVHGSKLSVKAKSKMQKRIIHGEEFYYTKGKTPNKTLTKAFEGKKAMLSALAEYIFKETLGG